MFLCLVFLMLWRLFIAALWSPAGKRLTYWLVLVMFMVCFVTITCGILGQVWYLIVSFPNLCHLSYFFKPKKINLFIIYIIMFYSSTKRV